MRKKRKPAETNPSPIRTTDLSIYIPNLLKLIYRSVLNDDPDLEGHVSWSEEMASDIKRGIIFTFHFPRKRDARKAKRRIEALNLVELFKTKFRLRLGKTKDI
jgi:hypothetical protein